MDTNETTPDRSTVALPGLCVRVGLPLPPNFLPEQHGGTVPIGKLHPEDAALLGMAMLRQVITHWRARWAKDQRLSESETLDIPSDALVHDSIVRAVASDTHAPQDLVRAVITAYLIEVTR